MGFFTGLDANDHDGHFNALRSMVEAKYRITIPASHKRDEFWRGAETIFNAPLGKEVKAFLDFIADVAASDVFEILVGDKGQMKSTDSCEYRLALRNLNDLDPSFAGLSFMETRSFRSYFSILASDQAHSPCPTANYSLEKYKGKPELVGDSFGDVSLISFALRCFGNNITTDGRSLWSSPSDLEAFLAEARRCFGDPAELGGDVYFFDSENAEILVRPIAYMEISLDVFDMSKPSPVSDELLRLVEGGIETFKV
ncbi:hypothetical protein [Celeribacter sp. SCSIO 80788]|uniref:hypothetical protein n=1 Tax=Celeribacter sp. SCSIO 80788 TaxID=3117013 RepID=UPI003DA50E7C